MSIKISKNNIKSPYFFGFVIIISLILFLWKAGFRPAGLIIKENKNTINNAQKKLEQKPPYYQDLDFEKIYLSDKEIYSIRQGRISAASGEVSDKVLRLALFYQEMKEAPLFFSQSLDLKKFEESVLRLKKEQNKFLAENKNLTAQIFPVNFLEKFGQASAAYKELDGKISLTNAGRLISVIKAAVNAYSDGAEELKKAISEYGARDLKYNGLDGEVYTTPVIALADLDKMIENGRLAAEELKEREKCLSESINFCSRPILDFIEPKLPPPFKPTRRILKKEELFAPAGDKLTGPYVVNSACWHNQEKQHLYAGLLCPKNLNYCYSWPFLATDMYFSKLVDFLPYDKSLLKLGVKAVPQISTAPYACADLEYQPNLETVDYVYSNFKNNRYFADIAGSGSPADLSEVINRGLAAENLFFAAEYPSQDNLNYLAGYYAYAYSTMSKNGLGTDALREEALKRFLLINEKTANLGLLIDRIIFHFTNLDASFGDLENRPGVSPLYIYMFRGNYSLMFLNFSPYVYLNQEKPEYFKINPEYSSNSAESEYIVNLESAIKLYGRENILKWQKIYRENDKHEFYNRLNKP